MEATATLDQSTQDFATKRGSYFMRRTTVGEYLDTLGLYDPSTRSCTWDSSITGAFQRVVLPISKNPIKRRMLRDMLRGGTLPPIVLYDRDSQRPQVVDGIQRTDVLTAALSTLLAIERDEKAKEDFAREELDVMHDLGQSPIKVDQFLARPVVCQVWRNLERDELVRLFMILNVGQQRVSPRHLLEVMGKDVRGMFEGWGMKLLTEREEKQQPRRRGPRKGGTDTEEGAVIPGLTHFRHEYLLDGLMAYVTRDPNVKTTQILQEKADSPNLALEERVAEIGSEFCRADFTWVCLDLNRAIQEKYKADPRWRIAIQNSDNFFIPLMAAIGDARHNAKARGALEDRKSKLLEIINSSTESDPLFLARIQADSLTNILDTIRSNIGRRQRGVVYNAWRRYFRFGLEDAEYPIDWRTAFLTD